MLLVARHATSPTRQHGTVLERAALTPSPGSQTLALTLWPKAGVLERVGLSAVEQGFVVSEADPLPPDLLAYLRLVHLGPPSTPSDAFLLEAPTPPLQLGTTTARPRHAHDMPKT